MEHNATATKLEFCADYELIKTSHISPLRASYGAYFWVLWINYTARYREYAVLSRLSWPMIVSPYILWSFSAAAYSITHKPLASPRPWIGAVHYNSLMQSWLHPIANALKFLSFFPANICTSSVWNQILYDPVKNSVYFLGWYSQFLS